VTSTLDTLDPAMAAAFTAPHEGVSSWQRMKLEQAMDTLPDKQKKVGW